jgi:tRNA(Ile)-lysidine synthase
VESFLTAEPLLRRHRSLLVAVSGGLDSMALLDALHQLQARHGWRLVVAHYNHQLRGDASDADELFVKAEAGRLGLQCVVGRGDVSALAKRKGVSIEMAARALRHKFLAHTARRLRIRVVALAHQADDQVELFFLRVLRGAGGQGLAGMRPSSRSPADAGLRLVRPLLPITREELEAWVKQRRLRFREDASNARLDYLRNKVRRRLLPLLEREFQPALRAITVRSMDVVGAEADFARRAAEVWLASRRRVPFHRLHPAVQRQTVCCQLQRRGVLAEFELVEHLRLRPGCAICVAPGLLLIRERSGLVRDSDPADSAFDPAELQVVLRGGRGRVPFGGCLLAWQLDPRRGARRLPRSRVGTEHFDADRVGQGICLRHWRAGDRFQPIGMKVAVKLQDLFVNAAVPRVERHQRLVAVASNGAVFWVEGLRIGDGFKLDKGTTRRLKWQWRRGEAPVASGQGA